MEKQIKKFTKILFVIEKSPLIHAHCKKLYLRKIAYNMHICISLEFVSSLVFLVWRELPDISLQFQSLTPSPSLYNRHQGQGGDFSECVLHKNWAVDWNKKIKV